MNLLETLRETFSTLRAHKMRSFLTMFGIVWGIASVILLVGLGRGFSKDEKERLKTIGTDIAIVWGGRTSSQAGGLAAGREIRLNVSDVELIKKEPAVIDFQDVGAELSHDPVTPIIVGVYPMRPVPRS